MANTPFNKPSDLVRRIVAKRKAQAGGPPPYDDEAANQEHADQQFNSQIEQFRAALTAGDKGKAFALTQEFNWERDQIAEEMQAWLES